MTDTDTDTDTDEAGFKIAVQQYRKKPVVISAIQWDGSMAQAMVTIDEFTNSKALLLGEEGSYLLEIATLKGDMIANPGDYIIKGVLGEFYPCKPDIFDQTYEEVTD